MRNYIFFTTLIIIMFLSSCLTPSQITQEPTNTNPCEGVNCPDICRGDELWSQICDKGECKDLKKIDDCSEYCGCKEDLCKAILCQDKCIDNSLWSSRCINGTCIQYQVKELCSQDCGCKPELQINEIQPIESWIFNDEKDTSKVIAMANTYLLYEKDKIGIVLTCRTEKCSDYPAVYYGYKAQGDKEFHDYIQIEDLSYWRPPLDGFYIIYFSPEYYMKIGYVD